ncbi:MAG: hypothetical protein AB1668_06245 [Nanoarchaeota archaeon]
MITDINLQKIILPVFDLELQRVVPHLKLETLQKQLNISSIFFDSVIISPSFVLESQLTERIVNDNKKLVDNGIISITIRENSLSLFLDKKINIYSKFKPFYERIFLDWSSWPILFNAKVVQRKIEIGKTLDARWLIELTSNNVFSLKNRIIKIFENDIFSKNPSVIIDKLKSIPGSRGEEPFVWELIKGRLECSKIEINQQQAKNLESIIRSHLLGLYFDILAETVGASVSSFYNIGLLTIDHLINNRIIHFNLIECIFKSLNIYSHILSFNDEQIIASKSNLEYRFFRETCLSLLNDIKYENDLFEKIQQEYLGEQKFFISSCMDLILKYKDKRFKTFIVSISKALEQEKPLSSISSNPLLVGIIENIPLYRFRDKILEIYKENCKSHISSFENDLVNVIKKSGGGLTMSNFTFNNPNIYNSNVGDHGIVNNNYHDNKEYIDKELDEIRVQVMKSDSELSHRIDALINDLKNMLSTNNISSAQKIWEEIKEGVKTSSALTGIVVGLSKLIGM